MPGPERASGRSTGSRLGTLLKARLDGPLLAPVRAFRLAYLPLLTIYLASGALGITAVADAFWVKQSLGLTPAELASLAVWLQLPWTAKMVVSEFVDALPILGSQRRSYTLIGAGLIAAGLVLLAGAAGGWIAFATPERIYVLAQMLVVIGSVVQEVVADAMGPEVVPRTEADGSPRRQEDIARDLAMVEVLARLTYSIGAFAVGGIAGLLAKTFSYEALFLMGLVVPLLSVSGGLLVTLRGGRARALDWRIFGGGVALAAVATLLALSAFRYAQEAVFLVSLTTICLMLKRVMLRITPDVRRRIAFVAAAIFAFRAVPMLGEGYRWFAIDRLGFDETFFGVLALTGTGVGLAAMWLLTDAVVRRSPVTVLLWLTGLAAILFLPSLLLAHGVQEWTERAWGIGARSIALIDEAAQSPLALLSTVPLLALVALHAPADQRATFFALVASLMSLAIVASQLATKYLNLLFPINRGSYEHLPDLVAAVIGIAVMLPLLTILALRRHLR
ncbi:MAG TPA: hypothetical protein VJ740_13585 [Hyphomicrobiaceae bacterium]|nr:hypothetical protein [Hyphomicrobiaceae bacterium]